MSQILNQFKSKKAAILLWGLLVFSTGSLALGTFFGIVDSKVSLLSCTLPVIGFFVEGWLALIAATILLVATNFLFPLPLFWGLPRLLGVASWATSQGKHPKSSAALHVALPLFCMALFACHPEGRVAFSYTLYWLLPPMLYLIQSYFGKNWLWARAVQSTFLTHACGSVLWLIAFPMTAEAWLNLIPVVAIERLSSVLMMIAFICAIIAGEALLMQKRAKAALGNCQKIK